MKQDANSIVRDHGVAQLRRVFDQAPTFAPGANTEPLQDDAPPYTNIPLRADGEPIHEPAGPPKVKIAVLPPLTLSEWRDRDLPPPDFIMGYWLTTTSRVLLTAATGLGKTNFGLALGMRIAAGADFLHWRAHRPARVLYIDGEMSRRLLKQRVLDEAQRLGASPEAFFALSRTAAAISPRAACARPDSLDG